MNVGSHADVPRHQVTGALGVELAVLLLHAFDQFLVTIAGAHEHGIFDGIGELGMSFVGLHDFKCLRRGGNADRAFGLGVGNDVVVFASARAAAHDLDSFIKGAGLLHDFADELGHGFAVPIAFAASAHFADGNMPVVHGGDGTDEAGI